jgi:hypothetical protein
MDTRERIQYLKLKVTILVQLLSRMGEDHFARLEIEDEIWGCDRKIAELEELISVDEERSSAA